MTDGERDIKEAVLESIAMKLMRDPKSKRLVLRIDGVLTGVIGRSPAEVFLNLADIMSDYDEPGAQ